MPIIQAPPGIVARYKNPARDGHPVRHTERPVIAFDDEGHALVLGNNGLVSASWHGNFDRLSDEPDHGDYLSLIPAGGWRAEYAGKDGSRWSEPLIGWALKPGSIIVPLATDSAGDVEDFESYGGEYRIYHPDAAQEPAQTTAATAAAAPAEGTPA